MVNEANRRRITSELLEAAKLGEDEARKVLHYDAEAFKDVALWLALDIVAVLALHHPVRRTNSIGWRWLGTTGTTQVAQTRDRPHSTHGQASTSVVHRGLRWDRALVMAEATKEHR